MALTIQERLKDLRVERGLTLEQLAEQIGLSRSALGSYEDEAALFQADRGRETVAALNYSKIRTGEKLCATER